MSRFIRTENGIYDTSKGLYTPSIKMWAIGFITIYDDQILKEADTIEELCDEFHIEFDSLWLPKEILYSKYYHFDIAKQNLEDNETLYGVIHIKGKGLIYVAKMNENGELVLI